MRIFPIIFLLAIFSSSDLVAQNNPKQDGSVKTPCDDNLWKHTYHKSRFKIIESCKQVSGIVEDVIKEKDGDYHIRLKLDKGQERLLNEKNILQQKGCLVAEIICATKVKQIGAIKACACFENQLKIPEKGTHVIITGPYVLDKKHGWMEIHPISKIEEKTMD